MSVMGQTYKGAMPAFGQLGDAELAAVLNHVRSAWANKSAPLAAGAGREGAQGESAHHAVRKRRRTESAGGEDALSRRTSMLMLRTALASALVVLLSHAATQWLTHDYQVWTAEGARRLEIALHPVAAPRIAMDGPGMQRQTLDALLADGRSVTIVDFMYTRCVTVCAALGGVFQQLQSAIVDGAAADGTAPLRLLSISFDPRHDEPAVLHVYAAGLRADPRIWRFARVAEAGHAQQLLERYQVVVIPDGLGGYEHNAALLVVDPAGRLVRVFDYTEQDVVLAFARSVADGGTK